MNVYQKPNFKLKTIIYITSLALVSCITVTPPTTQKEEKTDKPKNFPEPSTNWTKGNCPCEEIQLYLMESKKPPSWFQIGGEDIIDLPSNITSISEIPQTTKDKIKKRVIKANGCVVFLDLRDYYGSNMFPTRQNQELYYYWGTCK